ncbi:hypothetical protein PV327_001466 [Microctonus hyperodae]|uniref:Peptidase S1 domain-containing protein n=1 Tax=Microctonus hyperodae TaxID=165561 RepID=A0AA39G8A0_MICHY|nr:hypothetical protein PV327_001466 [Microctonus hyperodae]
MEETDKVKSKSKDIAVCHSNLSSKIRIINFPVERKIQMLNSTVKKKNNDNVFNYQKLNVRVSFVFIILLFITFGIIVYNILNEEIESEFQDIQASDKLSLQENSIIQDYLDISGLVTEIQSPTSNDLNYRVRRSVLDKSRGINNIKKSQNYHRERQTEEIKYKNNCKDMYNYCQSVFAYMEKYMLLDEETINNYLAFVDFKNVANPEIRDYLICLECQKMEYNEINQYHQLKSENDKLMFNYNQYPNENRQIDSTNLKTMTNPRSFVDDSPLTDRSNHEMIKKSSTSTANAPVKYYIPFPTQSANEETLSAPDFINPMSTRINRDTIIPEDNIYYDVLENQSFPARSIDIRSQTNQVDPKILSSPLYQYGMMPESNSPMIPTAETMKTGQQLQLTPVSVLPYPMCFYGPPPAVYPSPRQSQSPIKYPTAPTLSGFSPTSSGHRDYQYPSKNSDVGEGQGFVPLQSLNYEPAPVQSFANSPQLSSPNVGYNDQKFGPTGPGQSFMNVGYPQAFYCAFMPTFQFPTLPGDYQRSSGPSDEFQARESYTPYNRENNLTNVLSSGVAPSYNVNASSCKLNYLQCLDKSSCIMRAYWCDGIVHCPDASDETRCSCRDRIIKDRLCDGYFDCPHGEDELGCFGCPQNAFNCEDWTKQNQKGNCLTLSQRCDGIRQCRNGRDEKDCTALINNEIMDDEDIFTIGYTAGYLYKNYQGKWYPACTPTIDWAIESCTGELGTPSTNQPSPQMFPVPAPILQNQNLYISKLGNGQIALVEGCNKQTIYVNCPEILCGTRVNSPQDSYRSHLRFEDILVASPHFNLTDNQTDDNRTDQSKENDEMEKIILEQEQSSLDSRIVGGRASLPKAWPSIVTIYKNGLYKCGGVILNEYWILSAAHCLEKHHLYYYRIHAGLLRRFSYSPMEQTRRAEFIIIHPQYISSLKLNDLGLIKLNEPLRFNRWVRSICLPDNSPAFNPIPGKHCTAIGWGSTVEFGPEPDHLREVEVPILSSCKQSTDNTAAVICAGQIEGGKDACQGDSGGPLMCKISEFADQWYVAGIISHGIGCARPDEPGAYTNVAYFSPWINNTMHDNRALVGPKPLNKCPGFSCNGGFGKCLPSRRRCDKNVDCIDAEDEINCSYHTNPATFREVNESTPDLFNNSNPQNESYPLSDSTEVWTKKSILQLGDTPISMTTYATTDSILDTVGSTNVIDFTDEVTTEETPSTVNDLETATSDFPEQPLRFTCTKLIQSISMTARCNKIIDCEDGTDEVNCTCKDILMNVHPSAVCNGRVDCYDSTDEKDCNFCKENEFICVRSGSCIPQSKKCDHQMDCPLNEDELDCFNLFEYPLLDLDNRPATNTPGEGVLVKEVNGVWKPYCSDDPEGDDNKFNVNQICQYLGFKGMSWMSIAPTPNLTLLNEIEENDLEFDMTNSNSTLNLSLQNETNECVAIMTECRKTLISPANSYLYKNTSEEDNSIHMWPWQGAIFLDGKYHCPAIFLHDQWYLTSLRCTENIDLDLNATKLIVGMSPEYKFVPGPYENTRNVTMIKPFKEFNVSLLNVEPHPLSRYIQPIFAEERFSAPNAQDECFAMGTDPKFNSIETPFESVPDSCLSCDRCFRKKINDKECKNDTHSDWSGIVTCRGSGGWYPAAVFHEKDIICGFKTTQSLMSIDQMFPYLVDAMDNQYSSQSQLPYCDGIRCERGKCIPWKNVCNGIQDCEKAEDELANYCEEKRNICKNSNTMNCECSKSELKCRNGECISKEMFCDGKADCSDGTDEPNECNCGEYLKLTAPERVCDKIRHCYDKTDEQNCSCQEDTYRCVASNELQCIPYDFLCDGDKDCPSGEDESHCRMIKNNPKYATFGGEVLRRTFGVWHTECFPKPIETNAQAQQICESFGYLNGTILSTDEAAPQGPALQPEFDNFFMIRLSDQWAITTREAKPLVKLVPATNECHRAFIECL